MMICRFWILVAFFFCSVSAVATTVELVEMGKVDAMLRINGGAPKRVAVGDLTPEGIYLRALTPNYEAKLRINGVEESVTLGSTVSVAANDAGLPKLTITANPEGKFLGQFNALNQPFQVEIDPRRNVGILLPVADAERMGIPYKDPPPPKGEEKKKRKSEFPRPQKLSRAGKPYYNHFTEIKAVKVGGIFDLYGVKATVSEDPDLKVAVVGKQFLLLTDTTREGSLLTIRRLP